MIMNKYFYLINLLLVISCGLQSKYISNRETNIDLLLYTGIYNISPDSILVKTFTVFPSSNLVFVKKDEEFRASVESSLRLENSHEVQVQRISNINELIEQYYEDTRSSKLHQIEHEFLLSKEDYKITISIKDLDSFNVWDVSENINSSKQKLAMFSNYNGNRDKKYFTDNLEAHIDTIWIEIPKYLFDINNYNYTILKNKDILIDSEIKNCISYNNSDIEKLLFECPILITDEIFGDVEIRISSKLNDISSLFISINKELSLWSSDIDAILGVVSYILPYDDIKSLYKISKEEQLVFIRDYIDSKDLDLETNKNEFLELLKTRYLYANNNFSEYNIGWKTDRGEIYIVYGPPESIEYLYDNNKISNKEIWYYENKSFAFSDERTFGELKLIKEF